MVQDKLKGVLKCLNDVVDPMAIIKKYSMPKNCPLPWLRVIMTVMMYSRHCLQELLLCLLER